KTEIDEHVAAAHEVEPREGRVPGEVVAHEHAELPHLLADPIAVLEPDEVLAPRLLAEIAERGLREDAAPRFFRRLLAQVGPEDLDRLAVLQVADAFEQRDGERVDLLAGGASRHPRAEQRVVRLSLAQAGHNPL